MFSTAVKIKWKCDLAKQAALSCDEQNFLSAGLKLSTTKEKYVRLYIQPEHPLLSGQCCLSTSLLGTASKGCSQPGAQLKKCPLNQPRTKKPQCKPQAAPLGTASCSMHSPCFQGLCSQLMDHAVTYTSWARSNKKPLPCCTSAYIAVFNTKFCTTSYTRLTTWVRFSAGSLLQIPWYINQNMLSSVLPVNTLYGLLL